VLGKDKERVMLQIAQAIDSIPLDRGNHGY
jgi:hypothetical protein